MNSMKSIVMNDGRLRLEDIPMRVPGPGQVLVRDRRSARRIRYADETE
jgi:NADPH:quinone reductase-like Zn-dependent oxidoreductase